MEKVRIKVFVTKTRKFRAKIQEGKKAIPYEVTIGGESWQKGKGRQFEKEIERKCKILLMILQDELKCFDVHLDIE